MKSQWFLKLLRSVMLLGLVMLIMTGIGQANEPEEENNAGEIDILTLIPNKWGGNNFFNMDDYLRRGWNVTFAGLTNPVVPCYGFWYYSGVVDFPVDLLITDPIDTRDYDAIVLGPATSRTGPNPYGTLIDSPETLTLLQNAITFDKFIWSTCAGLRVFAAADLINGRDVVGNDRFTDEYEAAGANWLGDDHPPVKDGNVLTTVRGMYYHHHLNDFIARAVEQSTVWGGGLQQRGLLPVTSVNMELPGTTWATAIGTEYAEDIRDIQTVGTDGTIMAGFTWAEHMCDALLVRAGADGSVVWARTFGGDGTEYANSVCVTPEGGFILAGYTTSTTDDGTRDILVVCTDSSGNELWSKTYGGNGLDVANCIRPVSSGGYILCGHTESEGNGEDDVIVMRLTASGDVSWTTTAGGARADVGHTVCELPNGDFMVTGSNGSDDTMSHGNMDYYLIRLDSNGNELWWQTYGNDTGEGFDYCYHGIPTSDGGFILTGSSDATYPLDAVQIKTDASGNRQWFKSLGGEFYDYGTAITELRNGYAVATMIREADDWDNDLMVYLTDFNGESTWSTRIGGDGHEWINAICQGPDGSIIVAGQTSSAGAGKSDLFIARIDIPDNNTPATELLVPGQMFTAGDLFKVDARLWSPELESRQDIPLFVILDVLGELFFWPEWTSDTSYQLITLLPGTSSMNIIPEFPWPDGVGEFDGIGLYGAMTTSDFTALYGDLHHVTFGWK